MDTFFDSSWYYFRYAASSEKAPFVSDKANYWMPVDFYVGGETHAILHLIYSRFFTYVFRDFGWSKVSEPFPHLLTQGMVTLGGSAMSKSKGNIVDPDDLLKDYGADTVRLFILFAAPPEKSLEWNDQGVEGVNRFLHRIWNYFHTHRHTLSKGGDFDRSEAISKNLYLKLNQTIKKVSDDIEIRFHLNTAIAALMEFFNEFVSVSDALESKNPGLIATCFVQFLKLLNPFTPHFCNELWEELGHATILEDEEWPEFDPEFIQDEMVNVMVQINGKIREKVEVPLDEDEEIVRDAVFRSEKTRFYTEGKQVIKTIFIKNKMFSIVVK
jgi:leucyl-tRNA synthetase